MGGLQSPPPTRSLSLLHCGSPPSIWKCSEVRRKLDRSSVQCSFSQPRELCQGPSSRPEQCPAWLIAWIEKLIYSRIAEEGPYSKEHWSLWKLGWKISSAATAAEISTCCIQQQNLMATYTGSPKWPAHHTVSCHRGHQLATECAVQLLTMTTVKVRSPRRSKWWVFNMKKTLRC